MREFDPRYEERSIELEDRQTYLDDYVSYKLSDEDFEYDFPEDWMYNYISEEEWKSIVKDYRETYE